MAAKNTNVVMTVNTHDASRGQVVKVDADTAKRLIANGDAREPREGEVKAANGG